ncbi:hypothetical protein [Saccharopolyspora endophytica]|uniref:Uncharacterized protein n=1 Tax=Saccharopolyspora endophytica TaxID=543886 RepID=A0ABS5DQM6_9PSEU|nr:hypothetical protein [Saccharopolyspora endophytica]MBQ0928611.1 hypothetical protein [Saccharopolyspora endophytica]
MSADQERVLGWIAASVGHNGGPLSAATRIAFDIDANGCVSVSWRSGPTAASIASTLTETAGPELPVLVSTHLGDNSTVAHLTVGDVLVVLHAVEPDSGQRPRPVAERKETVWPSPLSEDGVAEHCVLWHYSPSYDLDTADATVVELPVGGRGPWWSEPAVVVAHADHDLRTRAERNWRSNADIVLRRATTTTTTAEADEWLATATTERVGTEFAALLWRDGTVRMQLTSRQASWRITARLNTGRSLHAPTALVPALVFAWIRQHPQRRAPHRVHLRRFGDGHTRGVWDLEAEMTAGLK